jgi:anti-sigma B factor antagonist
MTFLISEPTRGHSCVMRAGGELDLAAAPQLKEDLHRLIEEGERHLVLDCTDATFIDSTTIAALLSALRRVREYNGSLEIVCTNRNVLKAFEYAGLDQVFQIRGSLDDAVQAAPVI